MVRARIRVTLPDGTWKSDVTNEFTDAVFRLPSTSTCDGEAVEVVAVFGGVVETCLSALGEHSDVDASTVLHRGTDSAILRIRTTDPAFLTASGQAATPLVYPLELSDGVLIAEVISTYDCISELGTRLRAADLAFEVVYVQQDYETCPVLTERQREVLLAAVEHGYYGTPRQCSLTELADEIGIAKSTCSGMLHRAENALVEDYLRDRSTAPRRSGNERARREIEQSSRL